MTKGARQIYSCSRGPRMQMNNVARDTFSEKVQGERDESLGRFFFPTRPLSFFFLASLGGLSPLPVLTITGVKIWASRRFCVICDFRERAAEKEEWRKRERKTSPACEAVFRYALFSVAIFGRLQASDNNRFFDLRASSFFSCRLVFFPPNVTNK